MLLEIQFSQGLNFKWGNKCHLPKRILDMSGLYLFCRSSSCVWGPSTKFGTRVVHPIIGLSFLGDKYWRAQIWTVSLGFLLRGSRFQPWKRPPFGVENQYKMVKTHLLGVPFPHLKWVCYSLSRKKTIWNTTQSGEAFQFETNLENLGLTWMNFEHWEARHWAEKFAPSRFKVVKRRAWQAKFHTSAPKVFLTSHDEKTTSRHLCKFLQKRLFLARKQDQKCLFRVFWRRASK